MIGDSKQVITSLVILITLLCMRSASASAAPLLPSQGSTTFQFDDDSAGYAVDLDVNLDATGKRFRMALSQSADTSESADDSEQNLDSKSYSFGLSSNPANPVEFSANYEDWGQDDTFSIGTLSGTVRFNSTDWSFGLTPYLRNIDISRTNPSGRANNVSFDSQGLSVDLGFYGFEHFFIHGRYINYSYSEDVSKLDVASRPALSLFFTPATLSFSQGLEDSALSVAVDYSFNPVTVGIELSQSRSAVDDSLLNVTSFSLTWPLSHKWGATTGGGWFNREDQDEIRFFSGSLHYRW
ncbi:MAG: hypothetical protein MJA28_09910 [Gammaproteobacteria bacterium]|nr:hypothetical protein [Gammaproteobacteria bacterium]